VRNVENLQEKGKLDHVENEECVPVELVEKREKVEESSYQLQVKEMKDNEK
jgi:hypothetical protein